MQVKISPSPIASARYHHRQVIEKVRPACRSNKSAALAIAISALEADFHNAVSFSLAGTPCLATLGDVTLGRLSKSFHLSQIDRQALIAKLLIAINALSANDAIVPIPPDRIDGLTRGIEERACAIVDAGLVAIENNAAAPPGARWLPDEMLATVIANISKAVALIYSLGSPFAHMPALQKLFNGESKCKALSLLITIGWHFDRLEELLRPIVEMPSSESARMDFERQKTRAARARDTTLIVVHPEGAGVSYWSLWHLANHALIAPHPVLEGLSTAVAV